ncbi:MAG: DNA-processing protein DprA, partial [bacterium]
DLELLSYPQLAIVGSRNVSRPGEATTRAFAEHLAASGLGITSGLALGVDTAAHEGALKANGITLAVMGTGLDRVYPARNQPLARKIAEHGAVISEFPLGTRPSPQNFPRRNRIISGLSLGTLVVEAALRSGSLITAKYAREQGREVFAIPGSIHSPLAKGCHQLIRQGAKLVETSNHILEDLASQMAIDSSPADKAPENTQILDADHKRVLKAIDYHPTSVDMIITDSGLSAQEVSSILLIMELNGLIASEPGGYFVRIKSDEFA